MPDGVEGARKVNGGHHCPTRRLRAVKTIGDGLREENNLVKSAAAWAKAGLKRGQKIMRLDEERETGKDETLKKFGNTGRQRNGTKRRGSVRRFARFQHRDNRRHLPGGRERAGGPREVEEVKEKIEASGRKMTKKRV